jgi:hypothetical protein
MVKPEQMKEWLAMRSRLHAEERAFAAARAASARGEPTDPEEMSVKESEIRALRALSRSLFRRSFAAQDGSGTAPGREGPQAARPGGSRKHDS